MIINTITAIEISEGDQHLANVTMFDEGSAEVSIKSIVNAESFRKLAGAILSALQAMHLTGDMQNENTN